MTFTDWAVQSKDRLLTNSPKKAIQVSAREFWRGFYAKTVWPITDEKYKTTLAGESVSFIVDSKTELKRAQTANRELPVLEWLLEDATPNAVFWDVGAYHGHYSIVAAAKGAEVIAFEPHPENFERLKENMSINHGIVRPKKAALSNENTVKHLFGKELSEQEVSKSGEQTTTVWKGDDVDPKPDVVKIDVEGHEKEVLEGMEETLKGVERIAIEIHGLENILPVKYRLQNAGLDTTVIETDRSQTYIGGIR